ncbi:hypothetical protein [Baileyella intestinalis]|uniref:hypothetical protein n=1 Tax=Baileyella intestinalis TaxID=2606709 RepID=UPI0022E53C2A|nr:hypothetical protein [Baileyella intestinalis]
MNHKQISIARAVRRYQNRETEAYNEIFIYLVDMLGIYSRALAGSLARSAASDAPDSASGKKDKEREKESRENEKLIRKAQEDSEQLLQDTIREITDNLGNLRSTEAFDTWALGVLKRHARERQLRFIKAAGMSANNGNERGVTTDTISETFAMGLDEAINGAFHQKYNQGKTALSSESGRRTAFDDPAWDYDPKVGTSIWSINSAILDVMDKMEIPSVIATVAAYSQGMKVEDIAAALDQTIGDTKRMMMEDRRQIMEALGNFQNMGLDSAGTPAQFTAAAINSLSQNGRSLLPEGAEQRIYKIVTRKAGIRGIANPFTGKKKLFGRRHRDITNDWQSHGSEVSRENVGPAAPVILSKDQEPVPDIVLEPEKQTEPDEEPQEEPVILSDEGEKQSEQEEKAGEPKEPQEAEQAKAKTKTTEKAEKSQDISPEPPVKSQESSQEPEDKISRPVKKKRPSRNGKILGGIIAALLIAVIGSGAYYYFFHFIPMERQQKQEQTSMAAKATIIAAINESSGLFTAYGDSLNYVAKQQITLAWKNALKGGIKDEGASYYLADMNGDGIPELLSSSDSGNVLYTVYKAKLYSLKQPAGITGYIQGANSICFSYQEDQKAGDNIYKIVDGQFQRVAYGQYEMKFWSSFLEDLGWYSWNGQEVDASQYAKNKKAAFNENVAVFLYNGRSAAYTYEGIGDAIDKY